MSGHFRWTLVGTLAVMATIDCGCRRVTRTTAQPTLTASSVRAERRAFDGAPPVIPHESLGAACITCHTQTGKPVPNLAFAPANPHGSGGQFQNCRQCHLFRQDEQLFQPSEFEPLVASLAQGERLFPGAPPTVPHDEFMRKNCVACHAGPSARPEIRCSHPERVNCQQCHLPQRMTPAPDFVTVAGPSL